MFVIVYYTLDRFFLAYLSTLSFLFFSFPFLHDRVAYMFVLPTTSSYVHVYRTMLHRFPRAYFCGAATMHHPRRKNDGIVVGSRPGDDKGRYAPTSSSAFFSSPAARYNTSDEDTKTMRTKWLGDVARRRIEFDFDGTPSAAVLASGDDGNGDGSAPLVFSSACENALNGQIAREYELSLLYHSLACRYANRALNLPGLSKMFLEESDEERKHAQAIMDYVSTRGGNVRLRCLSVPSDPSLAASPSSASTVDQEKTSGGDFLDALHGLRTAYAAENENLVAIRALYDLAEEQRDVLLADWIAENLLREQVASVSHQYDLLMRLRRLGPGVGLDTFDRSLLFDLSS